MYSYQGRYVTEPFVETAPVVLKFYGETYLSDTHFLISKQKPVYR